MMPRGLDSVPNSMVLLVGVMVESPLVLLATLYVLRRSQGEQATTGAYETSDDVTHRRNDGSAKSTEMATEDVKPVRTTDEKDPNHCRRVLAENPNSVTTGSEKEGWTMLRKSNMRDDSYFQPCTSLAFVRALKSDEAASKLTFSVKALQLDWAFFTVTCVGSSIFLVILCVFAFGRVRNWQHKQ